MDEFFLTKEDRTILERKTWDDKVTLIIFTPDSFFCKGNTGIVSLNRLQDEEEVIAVKECHLSSFAVEILVSQLNFEIKNKKDGKYIFIIADINVDYKQVGAFLEDFNNGSAFIIKNIEDKKVLINSVFNPNSLHFLNHGNPFKFSKTLSMIEEFKKLLEKNHLNPDDFVIDTGMIMSLYGVRETGDLDFYCKNSIDSSFVDGYEEFEEHDSKQKSFYSVSTQDLITNPAFYFCFRGLKFISLQKLLSMKKRRLISQQDIKDIKDIKKILNIPTSKWQERTDSLLISLCWRKRQILGMCKAVLRKYLR